MVRIALNHLSNVSGVLRLSSPPSISDSLLAPLLCAFQASHPNLRVQVRVTERMVDHIAEGVDLFRIGALKDSTLVARRILTYRHQLVSQRPISRSASLPKYRKTCSITSAHILALAAGESLELCSCERKGEGKS
jgi:DNA-binding transcriptional LysR family regulator